MTFFVESFTPTSAPNCRPRSTRASEPALPSYESGLRLSSLPLGPQHSLHQGTPGQLPRGGQSGVQQGHGLSPGLSQLPFPRPSSHGTPDNPTLSQPVPPVQPQRQSRRAWRCWGESTHSERMAGIMHPPRNPRGALPCASHSSSSAVCSAREQDSRERRDTISGPEPPEGRVSLRVLGTFLPLFYRLQLLLMAQLPAERALSCTEMGSTLSVPCKIPHPGVRRRRHPWSGEHTTQRGSHGVMGLASHGVVPRRRGGNTLRALARGSGTRRASPPGWSQASRVRSRTVRACVPSQA